MAGRLTPWRRPSAFLAIWSHKLLRWATPILAGDRGASAPSRSGSAGAGVYLVPVAVGLVVLVLAGDRLGAPGPGATAALGSLPLAIVVVNLAFLNGWLNVLRGRRIETWHREEWTAAPKPNPTADGRR